PQVVGQLLEADLPEAAARAVGAAGIGGDQQFAGPREAAAAHLRPPASDAVGGELRRVVVDADAHPPLVVEQVVHAIGDHLAQTLVLEVMHADFLWAALGPPLPAAVLEIPDQFLLFRVHRDGRAAVAKAGTDQLVDVAELGVTVRVRASLAGLAVGLEAVTGFVQQPRHRSPAHRMAHPRQLVCQTARALARPA